MRKWYLVPFFNISRAATFDFDCLSANGVLLEYSLFLFFFLWETVEIVDTLRPIVPIFCFVREGLFLPDDDVVAVDTVGTPRNVRPGDGVYIYIVNA